MKVSKYLLLIVFTFLLQHAYGQEVIRYNDINKIQQIGGGVQILEDPHNAYSIEDILSSDKFVNSTQEVPNFEITPSTYWIKFNIANNTENDKLTLELAYPTIDSVTFVRVYPDGGYTATYTGEYIPYYDREYENQNYIFDLDIPKGEIRTFLLKLNASEQLQVPLELGSSQNILQAVSVRDLIFGLYIGIILVMFFYNLFIFFTVKDNNYLYYVFYIIFVGLTQACVQGYAAKFLYPSSPYLANFMMVLVPAMVGVTALLFLRVFLQLKQKLPKLNIGINILLVFYGIVIISGLLKHYRFAAQAVQINAMIGSVYVVIIGSILSARGNRTAKFFLLAWSIFLASVVVFVLRNFGVLPYNNFTYYALQIGSALEVVLLSFALADKINILRKEKEESQAQTVSALEENARIIKEQNVILETKVNERTLELKKSNEDLSKTLVDLQEAELQLVESEKMASLGQLTAGIAHEINNPINFVTSNVKPLKRDVDMIIDILNQVEELTYSDISIDEKRSKVEELKEEYDFDYLKTEIDYLLKGINEGSSRTAEIVKGLRVFSRLDEDDLKRADINEGIDSTLVIVNNLLNNEVVVEKDYASLPVVECYPGKLNQVFLNIISNGIQAVKEKYKGEAGGKIQIKTYNDENTVTICIKDNGTGMDEHTKKKVFEPFFTTKDVGEGTGLGMSIAYNTIKKHNGDIEINTTLGEGTEFIITIPIVHVTIENTEHER